MKVLQHWSVVLGLILSVLSLAMYAVNVSAYVATVAEKARANEDDLKYIRGRVDDIYNHLPPASK